MCQFEVQRILFSSEMWPVVPLVERKNGIASAHANQYKYNLAC